MPDNRRVWTDDDIAKLKEMAGQISREEIAAQLGRSVGATAVEASKLKISLRTHRYFGGPRQAGSDPSLGAIGPPPSGRTAKTTSKAGASIVSAFFSCRQIRKP